MDSQSSRLSLEELRATAELARLAVSDAELAELHHELAAVLTYAAELGAIDVTGVPPMTHAVTLRCPLRADVVGPHDPIAETLRNAPETAGAFFSVPAILGSDSSTDTEEDQSSGRG
jgi:aspartyl-tRNA(Asn)/glutamyl-tRNA(Gln) amidotransferase subunit C